MKIQLLSEGAQVPKRADEGAAGYDLYTPCDFIIRPGRNVVPLDIAIAIPHGYEGQIRPRSGFSARGIEGRCILLNGELGEAVRRYNADVIIGTIDENYRGNVGVLIKSNEKGRFAITKGTRLAQIVFSKYHAEDFEITDELDKTSREQGGFGSTGTH